MFVWINNKKSLGTKYVHYTELTKSLEKVHYITTFYHRFFHFLPLFSFVTLSFWLVKITSAWFQCFHDELGIPYSICVDSVTRDDGTVTIRDRDTLDQIRVKIEDLGDLLQELANKNCRDAFLCFEKIRIEQNGETVWKMLTFTKNHKKNAKSHEKTLTIQLHVSFN